jgi:hypothetical protein
MRVLLSRFYDSVQGSAPPPIPTAQILRVTRIIDQIVAGIAAAEPVDATSAHDQHTSADAGVTA